MTTQEETNKHNNYIKATPDITIVCPSCKSADHLTRVEEVRNIEPVHIDPILGGLNTGSASDTWWDSADVLYYRCSPDGTNNGCGFTFELDNDGKITSINNTYYRQPRKTLDAIHHLLNGCLLYTSPSPRDATLSRMPSSA